MCRYKIQYYGDTCNCQTGQFNKTCQYYSENEHLCPYFKSFETINKKQPPPKMNKYKFINKLV